MKSRYPILAHWMEIGLQEFPAFPTGYFDQILKAYIEMRMPLVRKAYRAGYNRSHGPSLFPVISDEIEDLVNEDSIKQKLIEVLKSKVEGDIAEACSKVKDECFEKLRLAREEAKTALDTTEVRRSYAHGAIPESRKGNKILILNDNEKLILKIVYKELHSCIAEIRIRLDLPARQNPGGQEAHCGLKDVKKTVPEASSLLKDEELLKIFNDTPSKISYQLLAKRLLKTGCLIDPIAPRTLKNFLSKSPLPEIFDPIRTP